METGMAILLAVTAIAALAASGAAFWAANEARKATRALLVSSLFDAAHSEGLQASQQEEPGEAGIPDADAPAPPQPPARSPGAPSPPAGEAQRSAGRFVNRILLLRKSNLLSNATLKSLMASGGMGVDLDMLKKLDVAAVPGIDPTTVATLSELRDMLGSGDFSVPTLRARMLNQLRKIDVKKLWEKLSQYL